MVALDLLGLDCTTTGSAASSTPSGKTSPSVGSSSFFPGDVVLAIYGKTKSFYWAKVKKIYRDTSGVEFCNVQWLRPQAGAHVGTLYVLHDGYDETQHGDGLMSSTHVRRP